MHRVGNQAFRIDAPSAPGAQSGSISFLYRMPMGKNHFQVILSCSPCININLIIDARSSGLLKQLQAGLKLQHCQSSLKCTNLTADIADGAAEHQS